MKKRLSLYILACAAIILPALSSAADFSITQTSNEVIGNSFRVQYSVPQAPATVKKIHLWVGEYSKIATTWISQNKVVQNLPTGNAGYPKTFAAEMDFTTLGITPGIKYAYALTDRNSGRLDEVTVYDPNNAELLEVHCFTKSGPVACKEAVVNPVLDSSSFTLETAGDQLDVEHTGNFMMTFSIKPNVTLYTPVDVTLYVNSEATGSPVEFKKGTFPIPAGSATTFPTVQDLPPGNYSAILYAGTTKVSGEIGFAVGATGPGGAKALFNYVGLPSVVCEAEASVCDFKIAINVTAPGTVKFSLYGYPKKYFDGKPKVEGVTLAGEDGFQSVAVGQQETNLSMSFIDIEAFTHETNDPDFWFNFYEQQNGKTSDVGNAFTSTTQGVPFNPNTGTPGGAGPGLDFGGKPGSDASNRCGNANNSSNPALTSSSANLCKQGTTVLEFNYDGFNYVWKCKGSDGISSSCNATGGTDTNYGDSFLKNPLAPGLDTFPKIFAAVYNNIILPIAVPFIVLSIMYAGFKFIIARKSGSTTTYADAKRILKYTLIGTALLLGGWVVANALQGTLNSLLGPESAKPAAYITDTNTVV